MKTKLKNILGLAALGMTLLATTTPTWAGKVTTDPVQIASNQTSRYASGSRVSARYSADDRQEIGCKSFGAAYTAATSQISCYARDSAGNFFSCFSEDPKFQEVVQAMTDSSYIYFAADLNRSTCSHIYMYHGSHLLK